MRTGGLGSAAAPGAAGGEHLLGDVEIVTDALGESQSLPVVLTLNGQQWTSSSVEYTYRSRRACRRSPTSGPVWGDDARDGVRRAL